MKQEFQRHLLKGRFFFATERRVTQTRRLRGGANFLGGRSRGKAERARKVPIGRYSVGAPKNPFGSEGRSRGKAEGADRAILFS